MTTPGENFMFFKVRNSFIARVILILAMFASTLGILPIQHALAATGDLLRVSVSSSGFQDNGTSGLNSISGDGRFATFDSSATNLLSGDTNAKIDVFVRENDIALPIPSQTVTKTADTNDGICNEDCSLREAVFAAASGDTIFFASSLAGQIIPLTSQINLDKNLTMDGSGLNPGVAISGNLTSRIFYISSN